MRKFCIHKLKYAALVAYFKHRAIYICPMSSLHDQLGNAVILQSPAKRIVSLVPSQSEFLWDLGLREQLVGVTRFCVHPPELRRAVASVGGTKKLDLRRIAGLRPDLVIGNKEENDQEQIIALQNKFPVYMSDIRDFEDAYRMMCDVGELTGRANEAGSLAGRIREVVDSVRDAFSGERVAYFIWNRPYMFAGANTFIDHVLTHIGFKNVAGNLERYPVLEIEDLRNAMPELSFLSSEPFPFRQIHARMLGELLPGAKILLVDGQVFSWYGSRLLNLKEYVKELELAIKGR
jgi:ABC-type Fe3+-hydroxamate transport system substrate-binding protein